MKTLKGLLTWLLQSCLTLLAFWLLTFLIWLGGPWYALASWGLMPALGLVSAYLATRRGLNNYIAWLAPPVSVFFAHFIVTGYTPGGAGPTLVTALLAIVGAAAGHVRNERKH